MFNKVAVNTEICLTAGPAAVLTQDLADVNLLAIVFVLWNEGMLHSLIGATCVTNRKYKRRGYMD